MNGVAPVPVRFNELCDAIAAATDRPSWLPVPGLVVRLLLGEGATVVLDGQRVLPKRAEALGFRWRYPTVDAALTQICGGGAPPPLAEAAAAAAPTEEGKEAAAVGSGGSGSP